MGDSILVKGARLHNLKNVTLAIPKNQLVVLTGLSGSGKSTLALDTLHKEGQRQYLESLGMVTYAGKPEISVGDASSSKVFAADQVQGLLDELTRVVHRYGDPADEETGQLAEYLDGQKKRNLVLTFGGGVQEVQRELIAMFGLGLPRVPR